MLKRESLLQETMHHTLSAVSCKEHNVLHTGGIVYYGEVSSNTSLHQ